MEKCLVTTLKGYVYNDALPKFKEFIMPVVSGTAYVNCAESTNIRAIGDVTINGEKVVSVNNGWNTLVIVGKGYIGIERLKYEITEINAPVDLSEGFGDSWLGMNISKFITSNYSNKSDINNNVYNVKDIVRLFPNLTTLEFGGVGVYGEIDGLLDLYKTLEKIGSVSSTSTGVSAMSITGIFDKLGYLSKIDNFYNFVASCKLDGSIENFVLIRRSATSNAAGSVQFNYINNNSTIYYKGNLLPNKRLTVVSWDSEGVITLTQQD